jgi:hypothetical protein
MVPLLINSFATAGGREKAPAAFCRKTITSTDRFEMWGDGEQTRSFTFIDECVEGVLRYPSLEWLFKFSFGPNSCNLFIQIHLVSSKKSFMLIFQVD